MLESETNSAVLSVSSSDPSSSSCCQLPSEEGITVSTPPPPPQGAPSATTNTDQPPPPPQQPSSTGQLNFECRQASIDSVRFSLLAEQHNSSNNSMLASTASDGGKDGATPHDITPEIAHRVRHLQIVRVSDRKTVVMESLWNNSVPEEPPQEATPQTAPEPPLGDASNSTTTTANDDGSVQPQKKSSKEKKKKQKATGAGAAVQQNRALPPPRRLPLLYNETDVCTDAPIVATERGQPALVCLFRRWGCCVCRMTAASLSALLPFLRPRGIRLVGIGHEEIGLKKFIAAGHFGGELYLDPTRALYQQVECRTVNWRSLWGILGSDSMVPKMIEQSLNRSFKINFEGDFTQFGGVFLIDANGVTRYLQIQTKQNFHIDTLRILATIGVTPPDDFDPLPNAYTTTW